MRYDDDDASSSLYAAQYSTLRWWVILYTYLVWHTKEPSSASKATSRKTMGLISERSAPPNHGLRAMGLMLL